VVSYELAVPGTATIAILTFSTPTLAHRESLERQFATIADSVRFAA
jgi:hypothetical protein